ncbi:MAG: FtsQ-type POTRA domain-containing protein [Nostocoides sp.]
MTGLADRRGVRSSRDRFEDRARAVRRRPLRRTVYAILALGLVVLVGWTLWSSSLLAVRSVAVDGLPAAESAAVKALATDQIGTPLARVDTTAIADRVRSRKAVAEVRVARSWPHTLTITAIPRIAALVLQNPSGQLEVVDSGGVLFGTVPSRPAGVPLVTATTADGLSPGAVAAALGVVGALPPALAQAVTGITVGSANLITFTAGSTEIVWGGAGQEALKVRIITTLLRSHPKVIDVSAPQTPVTR